ncbi:MAG TPA: tannase/feruloyl esterase family alpha/beta hydrolase [Vicinamibacterales bacterium]|nr:tannase/feruloyl esterase family alpha/beta hydrolase [Vicinamibacterales bacterium]
MRVELSAFAVLLLACAATAQPTPGAAACTSLKAFKVPGVALEITKLYWRAAGSTPPPAGPGGAGPASALKLPAYCRVDGAIDRRTGGDGKPYAIGFAITLPDNWNGRFLQQGGGGLNGNVAFPLGAAAAGATPALLRGFAVVTTDTGHAGTGFDSSFMREQQSALDFAYQAVGRVASLAKLIVAQYYGRPAAHSYFAGCSTGGREGMLMTERYPTYFDGVVVGAPAMRTNFSGIGDEWVAVALNQIAPKDANGRPVTRQALSDSDKKTVIDGILNQCDAADGAKDGLVFNTKCRFDPKLLVCKGPKVDGCLSAEQAAALEKGFGGPKDSKGRQVYPGFPFDTGIAATQGIPGHLNGGLNPVGPPFTATGMDVDARAEAALNPNAMLTMTSGWTDLNTFSNRGGKLLFYHGVSDPWFSANDTIDYYERMTAANGGASQVKNWSRLYLVPGMGHCGGGAATLDTFDLLGAVVDWVEKGSAPDNVIATGRAFPGRSRPMCAYPQHAHYKGSGDVETGNNFECRE